MKNLLAFTVIPCVNFSASVATLLFNVHCLPSTYRLKSFKHKAVRCCLGGTRPTTTCSACEVLSANFTRVTSNNRFASFSLLSDACDFEALLLLRPNRP